MIFEVVDLKTIVQKKKKVLRGGTFKATET